MIVRSINPDEINKFCRLGLDEEKALKFMEGIIKAWEEKRSYPEWCFVLEEDGVITGRVSFDIFASEPQNLMVWGLYIPEGCNYLWRGKELLKGAIEYFKHRGFRLIEHHLYGKDEVKFNAARELFLGGGFEAKQEKKSYLYTEGQLPCISGRLEFKNLKDVGEEAFINTIRLVTEKTLDTYDEMEVKELGADKAARNYFNGLKDINFIEDWWKLAYELNGDIVGLIVPQRFNEKVGAINYIGVTPEKRGSGYVKDLLIMGTGILKDQGVEEIIADIDVNNLPMENALVDMGYKLNARELVLEIRFKK